jgi:hypothetical protein
LNIENSGSECEFKIFSVNKTEGLQIPLCMSGIHPALTNLPSRGRPVCLP